MQLLEVVKELKVGQNLLSQLLKIFYNEISSLLIIFLFF